MFKIKILLLFLSSFLLIPGCRKDNPTEPQPSKLPGYQEDIPWPSLADSPWPMYRADPQNTGRSKSNGPAGVLYWSIDTVQSCSGAAISADSSVYLVHVGWPTSTGGLVKYKFNGETEWYRQFKLKYWESASTPIIDNEGTVYVSSPSEKKFYAINKNGSLKWELFLGAAVYQTGINMGKDGTLYALGYNNYKWSLFSISRTGNLNWEAGDLEVSGSGFSSMSFSPDGNVLYIPGPQSNSHSIIAFDVNSKSVLWKFGKDRPVLHSTPLVDSEGNIYLLSHDSSDNDVFYSLKKDGSIRWQYKIEPSYGMGYNMFTMDKNGNFYLDAGRVISLDYNGSYRWSYEKPVSVQSPLVCDNQSNIYFISMGENRSLISLSEDGSLRFEIEYPSTRTYTVFSPAAGYGRLFIPGYKNKIFTNYR